MIILAKVGCALLSMITVWAAFAVSEHFAFVVGVGLITLSIYGGKFDEN